MLFPRPPQPVGRRREVAAAVAAYKQPAMIAPGHVFLVPSRPAPPGQGDPPARAAVPDAPLSHDRHDTPV